jgi:hypothetical protein
VKGFKTQEGDTTGAFSIGGSIYLEQPGLCNQTWQGLKEGPWSVSSIYGMANKAQLWLLPWINPLKESPLELRIKASPPAPGVYLFRDSKGVVIYVGKSKCLKKRLASYKYIYPGNASRKYLRLVQAIDSIEWEILDNDQAALLRENLYIRKYRPRFNTARTHPESHLFISVRREGWHLIWSWSSQAPTVDCDPHTHRFGAFSAFATTHCLQALNRLYWARTTGPGEAAAIPLHLGFRRPPTPHDWNLKHFPEPERLYRKVADFFHGRSPALLHRLTGKNKSIPSGKSMDPWLREILRQDAETAERFFQFQCRPNHRIKTRVRRGVKYPIRQAELDDYRVLGHGAKVLE